MDIPNNLKTVEMCAPRNNAIKGSHILFIDVSTKSPQF